MLKGKAFPTSKRKGDNLLAHIKEVIHQGDKNGNGMPVRFRLPSGLEIMGLPTQNFYGGEWDLGPTWNYAILSDQPFLVDSGRYGQGKNLIHMMDSVGLKPEDLSFVIISHGHEDHDGGLAELVTVTGLPVKAHAVYDLMIRKYPAHAPPGHKQDFPAKCWHCEMPEEFYTKNCLGYHKVLQELTIDPVSNGTQALEPGIETHHLPGHSPDCLAVQIGGEAIVVGDIILPQITPWPTREALYDDVAQVIQPHFPNPQDLFGLRRYIRSLKKLLEIGSIHPDILVLPAHRLYYNEQWSGIDLAGRVKELLQHHMDRCAAILDILSAGPKTAQEIAKEHFEERLLKGYGRLMAENEVVSHCELLISCGNVRTLDNGTYEATGNTDVADYIKAL
jgi:glyoxylase-like metal-dependent hydrolase (beta-lactamase superfamily II)